MTINEIQDEVIVVIEKSFGSPIITKDGVTVAKEVELEDKFENIAFRFVVLIMDIMDFSQIISGL